MTVYWGNAEVYERHRLDCEEAAAEARAAGDFDKASELLLQAAAWRSRRDDDVRQQERRAINRCARRRTTWG